MYKERLAAVLGENSGAYSRWCQVFGCEPFKAGSFAGDNRLNGSLRDRDFVLSSEGVTVGVYSYELGLWLLRYEAWVDFFAKYGVHARYIGGTGMDAYMQDGVVGLMRVRVAG